MQTFRFLALCVSAVAVLVGASRPHPRPSDHSRTKMTLSQMCAIVGGGENGSGCAAFTDMTTCAYTAPAGTPPTKTTICDNDADREQKIQASKNACQGQYISGVGSIATAGPPPLPNTSQVGPDRNVLCHVNYVYKVSTERTFRLFDCGDGFPFNATNVLCVATSGKPVDSVAVRDCNDP
jgi:hypothetical protein